MLLIDIKKKKTLLKLVQIPCLGVVIMGLVLDLIILLYEAVRELPA